MSDNNTPEESNNPKRPHPRDFSDKDKKKDEYNTERFDEKGNLYIKLTMHDSALIVRQDGSIDIVSHELEGNDGYVGDIEDLSKTFSLVMALATALENEELYDRIFHNLNMTLMNRWTNLDPFVKEKIIEKRRNNALNQSNEQREEKKKRVEDFRDRMNKYKNNYLEELEKEKESLREDLEAEARWFQENGDAFIDPSAEGGHPDEDVFRERMKSRKQPPKKKKNPLNGMKDIDWNPYDETLTTKKGKWRLDAPPDEE